MFNIMFMHQNRNETVSHLKRAAQTVYLLGAKFKTAAQREFTRVDAFTR